MKEAEAIDNQWLQTGFGGMMPNLSSRLRGAIHGWMHGYPMVAQAAVVELSEEFKNTLSVLQATGSNLTESFQVLKDGFGKDELIRWLSSQMDEHPVDVLGLLPDVYDFDSMGEAKKACDLFGLSPFSLMSVTNKRGAAEFPNQLFKRGDSNSFEYGILGADIKTRMGIHKDSKVFAILCSERTLKSVARDGRRLVVNGSLAMVDLGEDKVTWPSHVDLWVKDSLILPDNMKIPKSAKVVVGHDVYQSDSGLKKEIIKVGSVEDFRSLRS